MLPLPILQLMFRSVGFDVPLPILQLMFRSVGFAVASANPAAVANFDGVINCV